MLGRVRGSGICLDAPCQGVPCLADQSRGARTSSSGVGLVNVSLPGRGGSQSETVRVRGLDAEDPREVLRGLLPLDASSSRCVSVSVRCRAHRSSARFRNGRPVGRLAWGSQTMTHGDIQGSDIQGSDIQGSGNGNGSRVATALTIVQFGGRRAHPFPDLASSRRARTRPSSRRRCRPSTGTTSVSRRSSARCSRSSRTTRRWSSSTSATSSAGRGTRRTSAAS